jgi:hypothetical protein
MKSFIKSIAVAAALIVPVASFAQSSALVTRAEVRAQLVQLEKVGYRVGDGDNAHYPDALEAAEAKVGAQQPATVDTSYGGTTDGTSDAGRPAVSSAEWNAMYSHP